MDLWIEWKLRLRKRTGNRSHIYLIEIRIETKPPECVNIFKLDKLWNCSATFESNSLVTHRYTHSAQLDRTTQFHYDNNNNTMNNKLFRFKATSDHMILGIHNLPWFFWEIFVCVCILATIDKCFTQLFGSECSICSSLGFIWGLSQSQSQINWMKSLIKPRYEQIRCRVGRKTESNCRVFIVLYILSVWVFGQWVVYKWISHLTRILGMKEMETHSRYYISKQRIKHQLHSIFFWA